MSGDGADKTEADIAGEGASEPPEAAAPDPGHDLPAAALLDPPESEAEVGPEAPEEHDPAQDPERDPAPDAPIEPAVESPPPLAETPPEPVPPSPSEAPASRSSIPPPAPSPAKPRGEFGRTVRRAFVLVLIALLVGPPLSVLAYRFIPPPFTWLMVERLVQGEGLVKHWTPLSDIDPSLPNAVIAAEDANFCTHHGFDFEAMRAAMRANARHPGKVRGGSTISQQTAKNVFLWPSRDYLRKGLEAYYTVLIEALWGKRRIMEVYLNEVEWGPGTYGAEAAAQRYFGEDASDIDPGEASRLAAILPSPLKWKAVNPGRYVQKRSRRIGAAAATVRGDGLASCLRR